jgi:23S rRNA (adenine1618-N6)-methyltransferase
VIRRSIKAQLHARNRFRAGYDFPALVAGTPSLGAFVGPNAHGDASIDYADPAAVKALNQALLAHAYGLRDWDLPPGGLCPPIPGRSDYLHYLADLLRADDGDEIPRGSSVTVLDIGTGASCIYPLIGAKEYGWRFVGTDTDPDALRWATSLVAANGMTELIECRRQPSPLSCFKDVIQPGERFDASMCNPPFHASAEEAAASSRQKRRHLGATRSTMGVLNFAGRDGELWCEGGELGFVQRMITESAGVRERCRWFTTLVSKSAHLPRLEQALRAVAATELKTIEMVHGQKTSRILAWTFAARG